MKQHPSSKNAIKALKKAAREDFGFQPTRISANRKKYNRAREKRVWLNLYDTDPLPSRA